MYDTPLDVTTCEKMQEKARLCTCINWPSLFSFHWPPHRPPKVPPDIDL